MNSRVLHRSSSERSGEFRSNYFRRVNERVLFKIPRVQERVVGSRDYDGMQEYKSLLGTNLPGRLIESDFEVAVDRYGSLHIIVVTLETPELLLCLGPSSSSFSSPSLPSSLSFSFSLPVGLCLYPSILRLLPHTVWQMRRYYFPIRSACRGIRFGTRDQWISYQKRPRTPQPRFSARYVPIVAIGHFLYVNVGTNI